MRMYKNLQYQLMRKKQSMPYVIGLKSPTEPESIQLRSQGFNIKLLQINNVSDLTIFPQNNSPNKLIISAQKLIKELNPSPIRNDRFFTPYQIIIHLNFAINSINISELVMNSIPKFVSNILKSLLILLILSILAHSQPFNNRNFCHSSCISYIGACFDTAPNACFVCANNIYRDKDFTNPYNPCVLKDQRAVLFNDLDSTRSLSLEGFTTSNTALFNCGAFPFSGRYINTDYIQKNFTGINTEHFELVIRFNVGYFGSWGTSDNLQLEVHDGVSTSYHSWGYSCGQTGSTSDTKNLCSTQGTDCIKIKEFTIQHNSSYVFLKWSSLTSQNNPNLQSWGIKDILIVAKTCHRYCDKCFGESVSQCLTCSPGYFLRGNTCVEKCPRLSIPATQQCVDSCPNNYFQNILNNHCEPCMDGCSVCSGQTQCLLWSDKEASPAGSLWYDKLELWIIMIIGGVLVMGLLLWKFVVKKYLLKSEQISSGSEDSKDDPIKSLKSSNSGELNQMKNTETNLTNQLWIVDAENLDPVKIDVRRRKKRKADVDQSLNNSEMHL